MKEARRHEIANERFMLIAPIVKFSKNSVIHGEKYEILRAIAAGKHPEIPENNKISLRTLERFVSAYEKGGIEALKPKQRERTQKIPREYLDLACDLKRENLQRSIETIITMLENSSKVPKGVLKRSTVYEYFTKKKLTRPTMGKKTGQFTRYGATHRGEILQGDVHYTFKLPHPSREGYQKQVYLVAWIDDYSRLCHGSFYWKENLPSLEDSLKKWIILYSSPVNIYVDNGAIYSSNYLKNICSTLGIQLLHSRPYKPQGRGKVEKFFQFVESSFKSELEILLKTQRALNLAQINQLFSIWLSRVYNTKIHSATKQSPINRWNSCEHQLKKPDLNTIYEAFLWQDTRKVSNTGIIGIETNQYEVEPFLCGKEIIVKYDPYDLSTGIRVFFDGKQYKDAVPAVLHRHSKKNFKKNVLSPEVPKSTGLNFLEQISDANLTPKEQLNFSRIVGNGGDS